MKGVYNLRPPKPRYTSTWDVGEVLTVLQTWGMPADLSDRQLSLKLVMLLAQQELTVLGRYATCRLRE